MLNGTQQPQESLMQSETKIAHRTMCEHPGPGTQKHHRLNSYMIASSLITSSVMILSAEVQILETWSVKRNSKPVTVQLWTFFVSLHTCYFF